MSIAAWIIDDSDVVATLRQLLTLHMATED